MGDISGDIFIVFYGMWLDWVRPSDQTTCKTREAQNKLPNMGCVGGCMQHIYVDSILYGSSVP